MLEYAIVGGYIRIPKSLFVQEMLSKDSNLRVFLDWNSARDITNRHLSIGEPDTDGMITINFTSDSGIVCAESPKDVLESLKRKFPDKIRGKVICRASYNLFGGVYIFQIDLDSDGKDVNYTIN